MLFLVPYVLDNSFYSTMTLKKAFILLGLTIGFVIIGLSRIYLGVHTLG